MERPSSDPNGGQVPHGLAARLLRSHLPYADTDDEPHILGGRLPEDAPFEIPIPEGFVLVGSAQVATRGRRRATEVVLDTSLSASRVRDVYRGLLSNDGWEEEHLGRSGGGGFARGPRGLLMVLGRALGRPRRGVNAEIPGLSAVFRGAERGTLILSAEERAGKPTDVRLRFVTHRGPLRRRHRNDPEALFVLPVLTPPPRAHVPDEGVHTTHLAPPFGARNSGGGYGGQAWEHDGAYSYAAIESDLDLPAITAHYTTQLEDAGWARSGEGVDGPQAWTTWAFSDNKGHPWTAAFTALRHPASTRRYLLNLRADRE